MQSHERRVRDHELLFEMYQNNSAFADLLQAAGNTERAEQVREQGRAVAREHVLDRVLDARHTTDCLVESVLSLLEFSAKAPHPKQIGPVEWASTFAPMLHAAVKPFTA